MLKVVQYINIINVYVIYKEFWTVSCGLEEHLTRGFNYPPPFILDSMESKYCILVNYNHYYYILMGCTVRSCTF